MITDEVYEHLVFDGHVHRPLATFPGMAERTLTLSSAGKSYSVTGWKIGWATGPAHLVAAVLDAKQWLSFSTGTPLPARGRPRPRPRARLPERARRATSQARRDLLCAGLAGSGSRRGCRRAPTSR